MSAPTQGEVIVLAASMIGADPENVDGATFIVAMKDGTVGVGSTGNCECGTLQILARAVERIANGMHAGEQP